MSPHGFRVAAEDAAVSRARRKILALVRTWDVPLTDEAFDELALLASEVITNAIRYSRASCVVVVRWTGARVRVEVTDTEPTRPIPRDEQLDAEGGRGLQLVESLAADWGSAAVPGGKVVWFEVGAEDVEQGAAIGPAGPLSEPGSRAAEAGRLVRPAWPDAYARWAPNGLQTWLHRIC
ncbi:ATP-binding protein [Streptomyces sp. CA-111067]|uniref:ATP-binding protein n=1 Tax=Streptomyces sp. CA-111067 TaxID=3240046 RepID=UPI003D994ACA